MAPGTVVNTRAEHATLAGHAETLRLRAREHWACLLVNASARHLAVTAVALDTLLCNLLPVVIENLFQETALEASGAAFARLQHWVLAGWCGATDGMALDLAPCACADITVLLPYRAVRPHGVVDMAVALAFALFHRRDPLLSLR